MNAPPPGGGAAFSSSAYGIGTWSGWSGVLAASKTLSVTAAVAISGSGGTSNQLAYTLDGSTWTNFFSATGALASATYTVVLAVGQNLSNVAVRAFSQSLVTVGGSTLAQVSAAMTVSGLGIA